MFTVTQGLGLILIYFVFIIALTWVTSRQGGRSKEQFLVAGRNISVWPGAFSIAATWVWAPALFVAAEQAYIHGWPGLFWFTVPNILTIIIFTYFASKIRQKVPRGYTVSGYMRQRFSQRTGHIYTVELSALAICSFAVQLLAGGMLISMLTNIPFMYVALLMVVISLSYSLLSGIRGSIITDFAQMTLIIAAGAVLVPWAIIEAGGFEIVREGLAGRTGTFTSLFTGDGATVFYTFGLATTIGLIAGPFGDQSFWQRAFSINARSLKRAFVYGALVFGVVPLTMGTLGFGAAGVGLQAGMPGMVNVEFVMQYLPAWAVAIFSYIIISGLISTLDSNLCAISSIMGHDWTRAEDEKKIVWRSRLAMLVLAVLAFGIAIIPGMRIVYLFLFYGILRATVMLPTAMALVWDRVSEKGMFYGVLVAMIVGLPIFGYGNFTGDTTLSIVGSLLTIGLSGAIVLGTTLLGSEQIAPDKEKEGAF